MDTTGIEGLWIEIQFHVHLWDFYAALTLISPTYWRVQKYLLHIAYIVVSEDIDFIAVENSNPLDCLIKIHHPSNRQRVYETIKLLDRYPGSWFMRMGLYARYPLNNFEMDHYTPHCRERYGALNKM